MRVCEHECCVYAATNTQHLALHDLLYYFHPSRPPPHPLAATRASVFFLHLLSGSQFLMTTSNAMYPYQNAQQIFKRTPTQSSAKVVCTGL
jgi:hypothetical protein